MDVRNGISSVKMCSKSCIRSRLFLVTDAIHQNHPQRITYPANLTLLVGQHDGHPAYKNLDFELSPLQSAVSLSVKRPLFQMNLE